MFNLHSVSPSLSFIRSHKKALVLQEKRSQGVDDSISLRAWPILLPEGLEPKQIGRSPGLESSHSIPFPFSQWFDGLLSITVAGPRRTYTDLPYYVSQQLTPIRFVNMRFVSIISLEHFSVK